MENLYWKTKIQTRNLTNMPFENENEFESYVFKNQDLLGDIFILHRQIRTGNKQGIPDMLGVDQDANICIIEMKNTEVGEEILPQILGYAIWADTNPDSIKAMWLESHNKPEDIEIDWDDLEIRVIVIAPDFSSNLPRMASKIGYPIQLVRIQRFVFEDSDEFLLVETLDDQISTKIKTTKVLEDWSWDYYEGSHGKDATAQFKKAVEAIDSFVKRQKWDLPYNLNKYYTGFKLGNKVVFNVAWGGTHAWVVRAKISEEDANSFKGEHWEFQRYDDSFSQALFRPISRKMIGFN
ncbi:hypothetical protein ACFLXB_08230 [Chloroflexota bacterium]